MCLRRGGGGGGGGGGHRGGGGGGGGGGGIAKRWFWRYEGDHVVERGVEGGASQTLTYDDLGRLTSRVGEYDRESTSLWITRDDEGRTVKECQGSHDALYTSCVETTYDPGGRVAFRTQTTTTAGDQGEPALIEHNLHVCE